MLMVMMNTLLITLSSYQNYKIYAKKIFELRTKNINYGYFYDSLNSSSINKEDMLKVLSKYQINSVFDDTSHWSKPSIDMTIHWSNGDSFDKSHVIHEICHLIQDDFNIPITYSLTEYGLNSPLETIAEDVM